MSNECGGIRGARYLFLKATPNGFEPQYLGNFNHPDQVLHMSKNEGETHTGSLLYPKQIPYGYEPARRSDTKKSPCDNFFRRDGVLGVCYKWVWSALAWEVNPLLTSG